MNTKRKVDKRYVPLTEVKTERLQEYRIGPRQVLRPGTQVKVSGQRGAVFTFQYAERNLETGAVSLAFVGGRAGHILDRFFRPEQVSKVLRTKG